MSQSMFFTQSSLSFQSNPMVCDKVNIPIEGAYFGILNLQAQQTAITRSNQEFVFVIDESGSMSDICSDGRTKMQHIVHTLKNMIIYFKNNLKNAHICVYVFDHNFSCVIERTMVDEDNFNEIMTKIDTIHPRGNTNIEKALKNIGDVIDNIIERYPTHSVNHVFMTDGESTMGSDDIHLLKELVNPNIYNSFIGFGINHDSYLLNGISSNTKSSYYFIDELEKAGLVYGEILHNVLYKLLTDVEIHIKNGLIYDFKTNTWVEKLAIGDIVGESNKMYHIISKTPDNCFAFIEAIYEDCPLRLSVGKFLAEPFDYTRYLYRQRTLQLLYNVNEIYNKKITTNKIFRWSEVNNDDINEEKTQIKLKIRNFIEEIKKYMLDNHLTNDSFLKNLCDDVYISYRTLGTKYGAMFTTARQTSQGTQRCYTVRQTPDEPFDDNVETLYLMNTKQTIFANNIGNIALDYEPLQHDVSEFNDTPYLTPTATKLMRDISYGVSEEAEP